MGGLFGFLGLYYWDQRNTNFSLCYLDSFPECATYDVNCFANCDHTVDWHAKTADAIGLNFPMTAAPNGEVSGCLLERARGIVPATFSLNQNQCVPNIIYGSEVGRGDVCVRYLGR